MKIQTENLVGKRRYTNWHLLARYVVVDEGRGMVVDATPNLSKSTLHAGRIGQSLGLVPGSGCFIQLVVIDPQTISDMTYHQHIIPFHAFYTHEKQAADQRGLYSLLSVGSRPTAKLHDGSVVLPQRKAPHGILVLVSVGRARLAVAKESQFVSLLLGSKSCQCVANGIIEVSELWNDAGPEARVKVRQEAWD